MRGRCDEHVVERGHMCEGAAMSMWLCAPHPFHASEESFKDSMSLLVQQMLKYFPFPALRVAHIVESVELLQLVPADFPDIASNGNLYQPPADEHYLVKELMRSQGILQKLTMHLKEAALQDQVGLMSILCQFLQGSTNAKSEFKSLDGYSIFGIILSSASTPDPPTCSSLLNHAFYNIRSDCSRFL